MQAAAEHALHRRSSGGRDDVYFDPMLGEEFFFLGDEIKAGAGIDARLTDGHFELRAGRVVAKRSNKK